jgi:rubrerythrin
VREHDKDEVIDLSAREKHLLKAMIDEEMQHRSWLRGPRGKQ